MTASDRRLEFSQKRHLLPNQYVDIKFSKDIWKSQTMAELLPLPDFKYLQNFTIL